MINNPVVKRLSLFAENFVRALIVLSLIAMPVETLPRIKPAVLSVLEGFELFTVAVFTVEYLIRLITAERKLKYVLSFGGVVDMAAVLPFYLSAGIDLRPLRILRLLRILKLFRFGKSAERLTAAFLSIRSELCIFLIITAVLLYFSATGIYYFENAAQPEHFKSIPHSLWWGAVTLTTVGYGDVYPITAGGRIFTFGVLIAGMGVVAVPSALMASALTKYRKDN